MAKVDPYKHKERYLNWKENTKDGIPSVSKANSEVIKRYLHDMEYGVNIASSNIRGGRSYIRLNTLRDKMIFFSERFKEEFDIDNITEITEEKITMFFTKMRKGEITKKIGNGAYKGIGYYVKVFKAFWHWWIKVNRKEKKEIEDITFDLDTSVEKPDWVYLNEDEFRKLCDNAKPDYRTLMMFLYDSGIRSPTELMNVKISDLNKECTNLEIRDEASKTFGRKIKLMICSKLLQDYIKEHELKQDDFLFKISPPNVNRYFRRLAERILGNNETKAGGKYSELTMYDFRHNSACYWVVRYKSESALKYRFGWTKSNMIHYYTELLGMKDTIAEEDLLIDVTKTELEKAIVQERKARALMEEKFEGMNKLILELQQEVKSIKAEAQTL